MASSPPMNHKRHVLIVDDHVLFRECLTAVLDATPDFRVVGGAGSVQEALQNARRLKPDIILVDLSLPDGTGLEATRAILAELPACQIFLLPMDEDADALLAAIRHGARGLVSKNAPTAQLLTRLRSLETGD